MEPDTTVAKKIKDQRTRGQRAKYNHEKASAERRQTAGDTRLAYQSLKDHPALLDIIAKAKQFAAYHTKLAQDGVGYRNTGAKLTDGSMEQEIYYFDHNKRVTELDKSAGLLEIVDYIERQLKLEDKKSSL